jgi:hypothetical protein
VPSNSDIIASGSLAKPSMLALLDDGNGRAAHRVAQRDGGPFRRSIAHEIALIWIDRKHRVPEQNLAFAYGRNVGLDELEITPFGRTLRPRCEHILAIFTVRHVPSLADILKCNDHYVTVIKIMDARCQA